MVTVLALWLPILVSAVLVFIVSSIIHTVLPYHNSDFRKMPSEDGIRNDLRKYNIPPGDYIIPGVTDPAERKTPEFAAKAEEGPVAFVTVMENGMPKMGGQLAMWFLYCVLVGVFAAYIAGRALPEGAPYLAVFRFAGATAFAGYGLALFQGAIWYHRSWSMTLKSVFDALVYALVTAGVFGWLWAQPAGA